MLSNEQVEAFYSDGCVVIPRALSPELIAEVAQAFDRLKERAATLTSTQMLDGSYFVVEGERIDRVVWCGAAEPRLLEISARPEFVDASSQLLGSKEMEQLICQAHFKIPGDEVSFRWHQDSENRRYGTPEWKDVNGKGSYVQTILAVDAMTEENGPLRLARGSALGGHLSLDKLEEPLEEVDPAAIFTLTMEPGDLAFLHPFTVHGSEPNRSKVARRIFINGYAYPGANGRIYPGEGSARKLVAG